MKALVVNADDFGLTRSFNAGVLKAFREGLVTDISILPAGHSFDDAVRLAREYGIKELGAHLSLTAFSPVSSRTEIPSLIDREGRLLKDRAAFLLRYCTGKIAREEIYRELANQLKKVLDSGFVVTHLDSHEHLHMLPGILKIFMRLSHEHKITALRNFGGDRPSSVSFEAVYRFIISSILGARARMVLRRNGLVTNRYLLGFIDSGRLDETLLETKIASLRDGITELVCHPGIIEAALVPQFPWHAGSGKELQALTSARMKALCDKAGVKLVSYRDILDGDA